MNQAWWMAGIHSDVYLYATDQVHVEDVQLHARLEADDQGELTVGTFAVRATVGSATRP